jgi:hypothetical protein
MSSNPARGKDMSVCILRVLEFTQSLTEIRTRNCFWGVECGLCSGLTTLPQTLSRLSRERGILNISQSYRPPRPVTGMALLRVRWVYVISPDRRQDILTDCLTVSRKVTSTWLQWFPRTNMVQVFERIRTLTKWFWSTESREQFSLKFYVPAEWSVGESSCQKDFCSLEGVALIRPTHVPPIIVTIFLDE